MTRWEFRIVSCLAGGKAPATCLKMLVVVVVIFIFNTQISTTNKKMNPFIEKMNAGYPFCRFAMICTSEFA